MRKLAVSLLSACLLTAPAWAQSFDAPVQEEGAVAAEASAAAAVDAAPEQIHVVAQRPGPGMWKVSKGGHHLWVFGTYGPVPKDMQWRSQQVENVIARSQEYLEPPGATFKPGFFRTITLLPHLIGMRKNPDGAKLVDVMPAEDYARWTALKARYLADNDDVERERPVFAADALTRSARRQAGLADGRAVSKQVLALVEKAKLKQTSSIFEIPMDNARTVLKNYKKSSMNDAVCLAQTMASLESDLDAASQRAQAWAKGDMDAMRKLDFAAREEACFSSVMNSAAFDAEPAVRNMRALANEKWLVSAEKALENNLSTFATMPVADVLDPKGVIAALAAKGYVVEQPE